MKMRNSYTCPLELTHDIIRGKWKPIILWQLGKGAASPSALQNDIVGIGLQAVFFVLFLLHK